MKAIKHKKYQSKDRAKHFETLMWAWSQHKSQEWFDGYFSALVDYDEYEELIKC